MPLKLVPLLALAQAQLAVVDDQIRPQQDILAYSIVVSIPDSGREISASVEVDYVMVGPGRHLVLDFDRGFTVDSVVSRGGARYDQAFDGDLLRIPHRAEPGDTLTVTIYYHGTPTDGLIIGPNGHGRRTAFADNWPDRARRWFPSEDHPSDKAFATFEVEVPDGWRVVANGAFIDSTRQDSGRSRWTWRTERPIATYTMVVGAGEMTVTDLPGGNVSQSLWTFVEDSAYAVSAFRRVGDIVRVYSELVGPFPYAKLAHVQSSTRYGGMENSSAIFYSQQAYISRRVSEGLIAHETAHQWFGDAVTEGDWHHLWLSEGFATYFAAVFFQAVGDEATFRRSMTGARNGYFRSDVVDRPIIDPAQRNLMGLLNGNNYSKGSWVLHMLRGELGDSAFFRGIREFYRVFRDSTAMSSDLMSVMEAQAGRSLETFFRQWLLQPGYPRVRLAWRPQGSDLVVEATQVQPQHWGVFEIALPLEIVDANGVRREVLELSGRRTVMTIESVSHVREVRPMTRDLLIEVEID